MRGALLFIGDELISGRIVNTNAEFAGRVLASFGFLPEEIVTIPDKEEKIVSTLRRLVEEYDFVIASGGLGPTEDDVTTEAVSKAFGLPLRIDEGLLNAILRSQEYQQTMEMAKRMALVPEGAITLAKDSKFVGFYLHYRGKKLFFLPGVPSQFRELLQERVLPELCISQRTSTRSDSMEGVHLKSLLFFDINETDLNSFIKNLKLNLRNNLKIGYYPLMPEVKLIIVGNREDVEELYNEIKGRFFLNIISESEEGLPIVVGQLLKGNSMNLTVAESCSGGLLSALITSVPGSSEYFEQGFVTYSLRSKEKTLGISEKVLREKGVYSHETAQEMAIRAKLLAGTTFALSTTGIAGPAGGTEETPVGTAFIGLATPREVYSVRFQFQGDRETIQRMISYTALDMLRRYITYGKGLSSYRFARDFKERAL